MHNNLDFLPQEYRYLVIHTGFATTSQEAEQVKVTLLRQDDCHIHQADRTRLLFHLRVLIFTLTILHIRLMITVQCS